jgi:hypothetical protein
MNAYRGSGGTAPRILDLGTRRRLVVSFTPQSLYPRGKSLRYPLDMRLGGPHILDAVEKREIRSPCRESNNDYPIVQPVSSRWLNQ